MKAQNPQQQRKKYERNTFLFLTIFLAPIVTIALIGAIGFIIWISQILTGPPTA
ncbi:nitrate reductase [Marinomonas agarivorans]|nr:nitrate reductase [Marinomonas agarivorans]